MRLTYENQWTSPKQFCKTEATRAECRRISAHGGPPPLQHLNVMGPSRCDFSGVRHEEQRLVETTVLQRNVVCMPMSDLQDFQYTIKLRVVVRPTKCTKDIRY